MEKAIVRNNITIEGARIIFRDFSGEKNRYNNDKTFTLALEEELADRLYSDGWPVRWLEPRNDDDERTPILTVKLMFGKYPPQVVMISGGKKKILTESEVHILDWANFEHVDVKITPYNYDFNGKKGVKAYLKSLWVTIAEDEFERKYQDLPYADGGTMPQEEEEMPFR